MLTAVLHAVFVVLQKGRHDPWLSLGAIDFSYMVVALLLAFFLPWLEAKLWPIFAGVLIIQRIHEILQVTPLCCDSHKAVYPVMWMTAPVFAIVAAHLVFEERFRITQWFGVWIMLSGIFCLAIYNIRFLKTNRDKLTVAMIFATATVVFTAIYTAYDAWASARRLTILFLWYGFLLLTDSVYRR